MSENNLYQSSAEEVVERFGIALAAQPPRASNYVLQFESGGKQLTPASQVMIIGHTDRVGSVEANDRLSKKRAESVRDLLIEAGVAPDKLEAAGQGERNPIVQTPDEVDEPRNRRVEINVR